MDIYRGDHIARDDVYAALVGSTADAYAMQNVPLGLGLDEDDTPVVYGGVQDEENQKKMEKSKMAYDTQTK